MNNVLLFASQSASRQRLLAEAALSFVQIEQLADESACDWSLSLSEVVRSIALHKMKSVVLPSAEHCKEIFVLTADTLTQDAQGVLLGKPTSLQDAHTKLDAVAKAPVTVGTAFCLDKKIYKFGSWQTADRIERFITATCKFEVPHFYREAYFKHTHALNASAAMHIDGYGAQFFEWIDGSYTTVLGLPMFELREALEKIGFF